MQLANVVLPSSSCTSSLSEPLFGENSRPSVATSAGTIITTPAGKSIGDVFRIDVRVARVVQPLVSNAQPWLHCRSPPLLPKPSQLCPFRFGGSLGVKGGSQASLPSTTPLPHSVVGSPVVRPLGICPTNDGWDDGRATGSHVAWQTNEKRDGHVSKRKRCWTRRGAAA